MSFNPFIPFTFYYSNFFAIDLLLKPLVSSPLLLTEVYVQCRTEVDVFPSGFDDCPSCLLRVCHVVSVHRDN